MQGLQRDKRSGLRALPVVWAMAACLQTAAWAAPQVVLQENFDAITNDELPEGWTRKIEGYDGADVSNLVGTTTRAYWKVIDKPYVLAGDTYFAGVTSKIAQAYTDGITPVGGNAKRFNTSMTTAAIDASAGANYSLSFKNFYREGSTNVETGQVLVQYDEQPPELVAEFGSNRQNTTETLYFQAPAGAKKLKLTWEYHRTSNNWYWGIDDVVLTSGVDLPANYAPALNVGPVLMAPSTTSMVVMVETTEKQPAVRYREKGSNGAFTTLPMVQAAKELKDDKIFFAPLSQLKPNTVYEYQVQTGSGSVPKTSPLYAFKTWPRAQDVSDGHQASFIAFSDTQDNRGGIFKSIVSKGIMGSERCQAANPAGTCVENIKGVMVGGDFVGSGETRAQWKQQFFDNFSALSPYVPLIPALGNHEFFGSRVEGDSDAEIAKWALTYRKYFALVPLPSSATRYPGHYYSLDYLDARIFSVGSTPMTAMHNTGSWNEADYDYGKKGFNANFSQEVQNWMSASLAEQDKKHLILLSHQPCLTSTWRVAETVLVCDLVSKMEQYAEKNNALAATLVGHSHAFDAGNSMNSRHLWFTVASASGALESATGGDNSDLDIFRNTRLDYGYSELQVQFGSQPRETWKRFSFDAADKPLAVGDDISISVQANPAQPQLEKSNFGGMAREAVQLRLKNVAPESIYESQWQLSRTPDFSGQVFDVWGDETRRTNLYFDAKGKTFDSRANADMLQLNLGQLVSAPQRLYPFTSDAVHKEQHKRITPGGDELGERWQCERKWDERQCYARLSYNGEKASPLDPFDGQCVPVLDLQDGDMWYVRARVRDEELNWSDWSDSGRFYVGQAPQENAQIAPIQPGGTGQPSQLSVTPDATCSLPLQAQSVELAAPPGMRLPFGAVDFSIGGCAVGVQALVRTEVPGTLAANAQLLKYQRSTGQWSPVPGAQRVGNGFEYLLVDGGELDEDGQRNGSLRDPYAIAEPAPTPPVDPVDPPVVPPVDPVDPPVVPPVDPVDPPVVPPVDPVDPPVDPVDPVDPPVTPANATPVPATGWPALALGMLSVLALACRRKQRRP